jgi:hypothetical protein
MRMIESLDVSDGFGQLYRKLDISRVALVIPINVPFVICE